MSKAILIDSSAFPIANLQAEPSGDDRVQCDTCRNSCKSFIVPLRCVEYSPNAEQQDKRTGRQRWVNLEEELNAYKTGKKPEASHS